LIAEVLKNFNVGYCVDMKNNKEIDYTLRRMIDQPNLLNTMSNNARLAYERYYNYDNFIAPVIDFMESKL
jgi:hypothetical protein